MTLLRRRFFCQRVYVCVSHFFDTHIEQMRSAYVDSVHHSKEDSVHGIPLPQDKSADTPALEHERELMSFNGELSMIYQVQILVFELSTSFDSSPHTYTNTFRYGSWRKVRFESVNLMPSCACYVSHYNYQMIVRNVTSARRKIRALLKEDAVLISLRRRLSGVSFTNNNILFILPMTKTGFILEISKQYTKKRYEFGRQPMFCEQGPEMCDSIMPNPNEHQLYILRNPVHEAIQNTPNFSEHQINTIRAEYTNSGANHSEGGWPKDVQISDPEATQRYRRKIEKDDNYIHCVMSCASGMEHYVLQNNAIELYQTYYTEMCQQPALEKCSCRTINVYRDPAPHGPPRPISSICWQPDGGRRFAVTYLNVDSNRNVHGDIRSHIWDIENANHPEVSLTPKCPLIDLQFSPREPNTLAGGLLNGQVGFWDRRHGGEPAGMCPPHVAHRELVRSVLFVNSKSGLEFFSGSPDGACKWWDMRNMEEPTEEIILDVIKSQFDVQTMANSYGVSVLEYEPTIPTRFMAGTENGFVVMGNKKGKTPMEKLPGKIEAHVGPVYSLERNPGFLKNYLTVGDWTVRVWSEECRESAVLWSPPLRQKVAAATWSPTRLSLMLVAQANGVIGLWDLLRKQHEPLLTMQVCEEQLLRIRAHEGGTLVANGSEKGNIYMVELSHNLSQSEKNDKVLLTAIFDRESKRERILEARMREIRLKMKQAEEGSPVASVTDMDPTLGDRDLADAAAEYIAAVKKEQAAMYDTFRP